MLFVVLLAGFSDYVPSEHGSSTGGGNAVGSAGGQLNEATSGTNRGVPRGEKVLLLRN